MIVLDSNSNPKQQGVDSKSDPHTAGTSVGPSHQQPLLINTAASPPPPPPYNSQPSHPYYPYYPTPVQYRQSPAKRFWGAFAVALLIWALFVMFTNSFIEMSHGLRQRVYAQLSGDSEPGRPEPSDGIVHSCVGSGNWSEYHERPNWAWGYPHGAETSFELDVDSAALYLVSRGSRHSGGVNIVQSEVEGDKVGVNVRVGYYYEPALARATVCLLERRQGENGVGIFTPTWILDPHRDWKDNLKFEVTVTLPAGKDDEALNIKNFDAHTPLFSYNVGTFFDSVFFEKISIRTSNMPIKVGHVTTGVGSFQSSNAAIDGNFNTDTALTLVTSNARVTVAVDLLNRENARATELEVKTSNGLIDASVLLESSTGSGGSFKVSTTTSNSPLMLKFPSSPASSHLECTARTSNSHADVQMHAAFEGRFEVDTSNMWPSLQQRQDVEDPAHQGRRRVVDEVRRTKNHISGKVYWGNEGVGRNGGFVSVRTSNAMAKLTV
ncbi:hypothetical protein BV22DRAFT_1198201 [Leucogyrophana mollusca]|uniref:Uncharacterized protein n=1 Tax=Leucogyrophana mollusca TaxID=85980 RepID=A0ACB8B6L4_9AGAM|nr:hypothetical protein BV22DRAFT_1198201 [Leucogyrophana mollusca]